MEPNLIFKQLSYKQDAPMEQGGGYERWDKRRLKAAVATVQYNEDRVGKRFFSQIN